MDSTTNTVPTYIQKSPRPKWLMPLSITSLVVLVAALASGITYALVNNSNNSKTSSSNTANTVTVTPVLTTVVTSIVTSIPISTTVFPTLTPFKSYVSVKGWSFQYPTSWTLTTESDNIVVSSPSINTHAAKISLNNIYGGGYIINDYTQCLNVSTDPNNGKGAALGHSFAQKAILSKINDYNLCSYFEYEVGGPIPQTTGYFFIKNPQNNKIINLKFTESLSNSNSEITLDQFKLLPALNEIVMESPL